VFGRYLKETFARLLNDLLSQANMRFELDPQKMTREDDAQVNQYNLSQVCAQYLAAIRSSLVHRPLLPYRYLSSTDPAGVFCVCEECMSDAVA
jgi:hypothetical protein